MVLGLGCCDLRSCLFFAKIFGLEEKMNESHAKRVVEVFAVLFHPVNLQIQFHPINFTGKLGIIPGFVFKLIG